MITSSYVGLDIHAETIAVVLADLVRGHRPADRGNVDGAYLTAQIGTSTPIYNRELHTDGQQILTDILPKE